MSTSARSTSCSVTQHDAVLCGTELVSDSSLGVDKLLTSGYTVQGALAAFVPISPANNHLLVLQVGSARCTTQLTHSYRSSGAALPAACGHASSTSTSSSSFKPSIGDLKLKGRPWRRQILLLVIIVLGASLSRGRRGPPGSVRQCPALDQAGPPPEECHLKSLRWS